MNSKPALRVVVMEEVAMVLKYSHISFTAGATTLSLFYPYASLIMPTAG